MTSRRETIRIRVKYPGKPAEWRDVEGRSTACPELWITRTFNPENIRGYGKGRRWTVTHRPTGFSAYHAKTLAQAVTYAREAARVSWDFTDPKTARERVEAHEAAWTAAEAV